jgi:hypothetical protein
LKKDAIRVKRKEGPSYPQNLTITRSILGPRSYAALLAT